MNFSQSANLTAEFVRTDFKLRYHGSYLGYLWSFIKPLMMFGVLYVVFSKFLRVDYPDYPLYLFLGIILWNFFAEATTGAMCSIVEKGGLIKKIYFPREIIVFSSVAVSFIVFISNLAIFGIFYLLAGLAFDLNMLFFLLYLLQLCVVTLGVAFFLSALYPKLSDLFHIWQVLLQVGFWATPITYILQIVPQKYAALILANPLAGIIYNSRLALINHQFPDAGSFLYALIAGIIILAAGYFLFSRRMPFFAEEV
jgi:ABC-type polysaccharide/polyol phosphate export permease